MNAKPINLIAACGTNRVIGREGKLPWSIPEDFDYFLETTRGGVLIEGRRAFEEFGKPFPDRTTIVLTRNPGWRSPDPSVLVAGSLPEAVERAQPLPGELWICGGQRVYEEALPLGHRLFLTVVDAAPEGDTFFPDWRSTFTHTLTERRSGDGSYTYTFYVLGRGQGAAAASPESERTTR